MRPGPHVVLAALLGCAVAHAADDVPVPSRFAIDARVWNKATLDTRIDDPVEHDSSNHLEARLGLVFTPLPWLSFAAGGEADLFVFERDPDVEHDVDARPQEIWVQFAQGPVRIRAGNQVVRWGRADEVSPLDIVNPEDLRDGVVRLRTERKLAVPMALAEVTLRRQYVQALFLPTFERSAFDVTGRDWALFGHADELDGLRFEEEEPDRISPRFGARVGGSIGGVDWALSGIQSKADVPTVGTIEGANGVVLERDATLFDLATAVADEGAVIPLGYEPVRTVGAEMETSAGNFGIRADVAYVDDRGFVRRDLTAVRRPTIDAVLGADYGRGASYLNVQIAESWVQDWDPEIILAEERTHRLTATARRDFAGTAVRAELRILYELGNEEGWYVNPVVRVSRWRGSRFSVGLDLLGGDASNTIGVYGRNSQAYVLLEQLF